MKPGASVGTRKAVTGGRPSVAAPVAVKRMTYLVSGVPELVMNCLAPLITHSSPSRTAAVAMLPASEPPLGSVRPKATNSSPAVILGSSSRRRPGGRQLGEERRAHGLHVHGHREGGVDPGQLLDGDRQTGHVNGRGIAAVVDELEDPEPGDRPHEIEIEGPGLVPRRRARGDDVAAELAQDVAPGVLLVRDTPRDLVPRQAAAALGQRMTPSILSSKSASVS